MPEMEMAGSYVAKAGVSAVVSAKVYDENHVLIADLGTIVGKRTKAEGRRTKELLAMLADRYEQARMKEMEHGG